MKIFIIYNAAGQIIQTGSVIESMLELQHDPDNGRFMLEGSGSLTRDRVVGGQIVPRPAMGHRLSSNVVPADGFTQARITGVPAGSAVQIAGPTSASGVADGDDILLTFALPGTYTVTLTLFPYIDAKEIIHAV